MELYKSTQQPITEFVTANASTKAPFVPPPGLQTAYTVMVNSILGIIMLAMGCGITISEIFSHLKRPFGVIIGAVSQFILLPLASFGLAHAFRLTSYQAIGMLIIACCPGGAVSNVFTFWSRGNVTLSIVMTTASTILALGMMPLNLFIYTRSWTSKTVTIPYANIAIGLVLILVPVAIGILIKRKFPKPAYIITRVGSVFGILLILIAGIMQRYLYPQVFDLKWTVWLAAFLLPIIGFTMGFLLATMFCQPLPYRRTIGFETGCQNVALALSLISISFQKNDANKFTQFPIIFAVFMMVDNFVIVFAHRIYYRIKDRVSKNYDVTDKEDANKKDPHKQREMTEITEKVDQPIENGKY